MNRGEMFPDAFGPALRFLRKRAHLTQDELGLAVGYSREQIARLENGSRLPDLAVIAAVFVPVLFRESEQQLIEKFLVLSGNQRSVGQSILPAPKKRQKQAPIELPDGYPSSPRYRPPVPLLPLIGRDSDMAELIHLLGVSRLTTILGAPGIGKTRLALEVAQVACSHFKDGVAYIPLSDVTRPEDIPYAVMRHLSITASPQQSVDEAIIAHIKTLNLLLVMDNCEHVLEGVQIFSEWLTRAPELKLLCTSRTRLDLYGEFEWPLSPLSAPDLAQPPDMESWGQTPAMQLLLRRTQAADPQFCLKANNLLPMATICVALDGLPLALELASVQLREKPPDVLAQQLLMRRGHPQLSSTWLQQTKRNISERHRTLQAAIDWSVRLLSPDAENTFCFLGVFQGGCSEDAARQVARATPEMLSVLERAYLIQYREGRITLLETLRAYAIERLVASNQWAACQRLHADYYAAFAHQVFDGLQGDEQEIWMPRALADHENCQEALRWALSQADGDLAIDLAGSLWWFWYRRGLFALGREHLSAALKLTSKDLSARARTLNGLASICLVQEDYDACLAYHQDGLALRQQIGDTTGVATSLHNMGLTAVMMGQYSEALELLKQSVELNPSADPTLSWAHMGLVAQELQDLPQARSWLEQAYQRALLAGEGWTQAFVMNFLADVLREMGDLQSAFRLAEESRHLFEFLEDSYYLPDAEMTLAQIALDQSDLNTALVLSQRVLVQYEARSDLGALAGVYLLQAELACQTGDLLQAQALLLRSRQMRWSIKRAVSPREKAHYQDLERRLVKPLLSRNQTEG